ncbi:response regulator transcription factor [Sulfurimonas sp.]|uniref:response regulator transcription factor n=1 Tax=Sulfurimonas sp. TaxID=2022749 RepID=UPI002AB0E2E0|nr:response regulator transcription factor [Sulfurimonas sp.]
MNNTKENYSILYIEDEKEIRENYVRYLKNHFINVYEAGDGEEAYEIYKSKKPQIMIIDINIPKLNGIDLLKKIRENDYTTKAIILSAHTELNYLLDATGLGLTKYLVKPVTRKELKDALSFVIEELTKYSIFSKKVLILKDGYRWDFEKEELRTNETILLTDKERQILSLLFSNINITYSYDDIIGNVWDSYDDDRVAALKTIIKNLRKKLPKETIKNVFGVGYTIEI